MKIQGVGMPEAERVNAISPTDSKSKEYQDQIADAQKKLKDVTSDEKLNEDEKEKERRELRQQITELNQKLRQHQVELREEQQKERAKELAAERQADKSAEEDGTVRETARVGMNAAVSADKDFSHARSQGSTARSMEGRVRVIQNEIRQDERRGVDTTYKEKELEELQEKTTKLKGAKMNIVTGAIKGMKKAVAPEPFMKKKADTDAARLSANPVAAAVGAGARNRTNPYIKGNMFSNVDFHF